ncbi:MAG: hypothetical protein V2B20_10495 [Pseudomonadota bacterium]
MCSPYHPTLPLTGEDSRRGSPVAIRTQFGTLSAGLRTNNTARSKHARVGSGRNMPVLQVSYLSTLKLCDIVSHSNVELTGAAHESREKRNQAVFRVRLNAGYAELLIITAESAPDERLPLFHFLYPPINTAKIIIELIFIADEVVPTTAASNRQMELFDCLKN